MKLIQSTLFVFILFSFISCQKYLSTKPSDTIVTTQYYANDAELNAALNGVYSYMAQDATFSRNIPCELETGNDEIQFNNRNNRVGIPSLYDCQSSNAIYSDCWSAFYAGINAANLLLSNIDASGASASSKQYIRGEALFLRAFYHFQLVTRFGDIPLRLTATTQVGNFNYPRNSSKQVYDSILSDMKAAEQLVRTIDNTGSGSRVSQTAVEGIIARVYLKMAGHPLNLGLPMYDSARVYAQKVVNSGLHNLNLDYKQIFINHSADIYEKGESIWEVEFYGNNTPSGTMPAGSRFASLYAMRYTGADPNPNVVYGYGSYIPTGYLYDSIYLKYPSDTLRRNWNIPVYTFSTYGSSDSTSILPVSAATPRAATSPWDRDCGKWKRENEKVIPKSRDWGPTNFPLLRYADVLLMLAEAHFELGNTTDALTNINLVRNRALAEPITVLTRNIIRDERARELCFEGLRKFDLVRWGAFNSAMTNCKIAINNSSSSNKNRYLVAYNNVGLRDTLLPIPSAELSVNSLMTQNAGW